MASARRVAYRHAVNRMLLDEAPLSARIADRVTMFMGSWRFIVIQTVIVIVWIVGNVYLLFNFDKYPFILLNLAFSTQAAYAAPLILLAGNRAALRDRMTLEHAADEADIEEKQNERLLSGNTEILHRVEALESRILDLEKNILARLDAGRTPSG
ncbi:MAG TPA: DUF1003 domain-containing protein [Candidatus Limnocylindrales bacterium]|nr:DUF1003 domain-containing protein [Candidatus Limnocylindrales bacterium]